MELRYWNTGISNRICEAIVAGNRNPQQRCEIRQGLICARKYKVKGVVGRVCGRCESMGCETVRKSNRYRINNSSGGRGRIIALCIYKKKRRITMGTYNVHAGHCPQGRGHQESVEDRIKKRSNPSVKSRRAHGNDCTCDENTTKQGCLNKIIAKCNQHSVDLDISLHLNSGRNDYGGDGSTGGVEVWNYDTGTGNLKQNLRSILNPQQRDEIRQGLICPNTKSKALLVE